MKLAKEDAIISTINGSECLRKHAVEFMREFDEWPEKYKYCPYGNFIARMSLKHERTPCGIEYLGEDLDYEYLDEMMAEAIVKNGGKTWQD